MRKPRVYPETSVLSYLAARPNRDLVRAARQQITHEWWEQRRSEFELFVSQLVIQEMSAGDPTVAAERLELSNGLAMLEFNEEAKSLGQELVPFVPLPRKAIVDAYHIAVAVVGGMDYLLTWNCKHIANPTLRRRIEDLCRFRGFEPPPICTPGELLGV